MKRDATKTWRVVDKEQRSAWVERGRGIERKLRSGKLERLDMRRGMKQSKEGDWRLRPSRPRLEHGAEKRREGGKGRRRMADCRVGQKGKERVGEGKN